ncbi:MAG TPA: histidine kinase dimerization/phosphoacceptor domain -containing protein [Polyangia bacterium]|nr:histidine kinase dimerization/phosphoacceptor domain -containing protein [Polyangia bacterium]
MKGAADPGEISPAAYSLALANILEDFAAERIGQDASQKALLNILDDVGSEKVRLEDTQRAILNIADDGEAERLRLRESQKAVLNILDDLGGEKALLEKTQSEVLRSEQTVRASLREKEVLLKEIHHRVKNNLQVISSLLNLQARYLPDPAARAIFSQSQNRVQSIALVHERLYESADLSHVNFAKYLAVLLDNVFDTHDATNRGISKVIDVGDANLTVDVAIPCGLIVNELVTNTLKHAFPGGRHGTVRVSLRETEDGILDLLVQDDGVGMPAGIDPRNTVSLGLDLVVTFAEQLNAEMDIVRQGGTSFRFRFRKGDQ